jgi:hypothetical protein
MQSPTAYVSVAVVLGLALALTGFGAIAAPIGPLKQAVGDVSWSVQPANTTNGTRTQFEYSTDPGTQVVDFVVVSNRGETAAEFAIYATDATNDVKTGAFGLLPSNIAPTDLGAWITMDADTVMLQPGEESTIPFNLLVPSDATPGDHVAGIIASISTVGENGEGATVDLEQRVGARMYLRVAGDVVASAEISGVTTSFTPELNPFAFGRVTVGYNVRNTGNVRVDVNQAVQITGPFGIPLAEITPEPLADLLPRQTVNVIAEIPQVAALFLAFSTISVEPGALGTAGTVPEENRSTTPAPQRTDSARTDSAPTDSEPADSVPAGSEPLDSGAAAEAGAGEAPVIDASNVDDSVDYVPVTSSSTALAISWTLLAMILAIILGVFLAFKYVTNTRNQMYAAIDEATAAAREEALAHTQKVAAP